MTAAATLEADVQSPTDVLAEKLEFLAEYEDLLNESAEFRRMVTKEDPLMFSLVYLPEQYIDEQSDLNDFTLSEFHVDLCKHALEWALCEHDKEDVQRDAYIAPRGCGKSTWFFLILPLWAAAHGHYDFIAAFGVSKDRATEHLATFKHEVENNDLLRADYPELCTPLRRTGGVVAGDRVDMYKAANEFVFAASGIRGSILGMKVGKRRPQLIILDDIEPPEEKYNATDRDKILTAVRDSILELSVYARVVLVGTVTMPGSLVHDLVKSVKEVDSRADWVDEVKLRVHYYPALITDEQGRQRSIWPEKWSVAFLQAMGRVTFFKNYQNDPMSYDGGYWTLQDFIYLPIDIETGSPVKFPARYTKLFIDPATTDGRKSDYTGFAVISYSDYGPKKQCLVRQCWQVKLSPGKETKFFAGQILEQFPEINEIWIESNQGGKVWLDVFSGLGRKVRVKPNSEKKEVRAMRLLKNYQDGKVIHERRLPDLETQMVAFPKAPNDDMVDAVGNGVDHFLTNGSTRVSRARMTNAMRYA
jgi:phage terminase large subunit-like protein